jgi:beta-1,4-N-acetylglucosaminyltransferase
MIFVAVGTTDFDALTMRMDRIAPTLSEEVVLQIGNGRYIPKNCQYFRFAPSLEPYYAQASVVVSHGGLGIITEALERGKKLISVQNTTCHGGHQEDLLRLLATEGYLIWCQDLDELPEVLERARKQAFRRYVAPDCGIHIVIKKFLQGPVD